MPFNKIKNTSKTTQFIFVFIFCTVVGFFLSAINQNSDYGLLIPNLGISYCIGFSVWGVDLLLKRNHWFGNDVIRAGVAILVGSALGGALGSYLFVYLFMENTTNFVFSELLRTLILGIFFSLISLYFVYSQRSIYQRREQLAAEKQKHTEQQQQLSQSRLQNLQAQIEPHFLFNTLANIYSRIDEQPKEAKAMMEKLTGILRYRLKSNQNSVALAQELQLVKDYLHIQKMRLGDRLEFSVDTAIHDCQVPPLLIQPLVENAVTHGIEAKIEGGKVDVQITINKEQLMICVLDNGIGFGKSKQSGNGLALKNIKERLQTLYAEQAKLEFTEDSTGRTKACINMPFVKKAL